MQALEEITTVVMDAHAYAFDGQPEYPGADTFHPSLVGISEMFAVLIRDVTAEIWGDNPWCLEYEITGPTDHVRAVVAEYWGDDMVTDMDEQGCW